jgi:transposase
LDELADLRKRIEDSQPRTDIRQIRRQKAPRRLSREETEELVKAYRDGFTVYELATHFGIHRETVSGVLERSGVPRRRKPLSPDQIEQACALRESGWTLAQVGAELECDPSTVWRALERFRNS